MTIDDVTSGPMVVGCNSNTHLVTYLPAWPNTHQPTTLAGLMSGVVAGGLEMMDGSYVMGQHGRASQPAWEP